MEQDLLLLFNNACTYNEPDSQIYKDALTLNRAMLKKKAELTSGDEEIVLPDVLALVQNLLNTLYTIVVNYKVRSYIYFSYSNSYSTVSKNIHKLIPSFEYF